ncbi:MAG: carboxylesterase family protein, partial [Gammaproteobacteria bacterium]|nr:carboxylesterase family protein [Gammaproteobacteria bacterium]
SSPNARDMFHGAIAQSGYSTWALPRTSNAPVPAPLNMNRESAASAEQMAVDLVDRITETPQSAHMMRSLDGMSLVNAVVGFQLPIVDGTSLPEEPGLLFLRGEQNPVPYISGGNSFEGSVQRASGISDDEYRKMIGDHLGSARTLYSDDPDDIWLTRMFGDNRYLLSARLLTGAMAKVSSPSWRYYHDFLSSDQAGQPGTNHGFDARYLFGGHLHKDPATRVLAMSWRRYWVSFAQTGNPNDPSSADWQAVDTMSDNWLLINNEGFESTERVIGTKLDLIEKVYRQRVSPALSN